MKELSLPHERVNVNGGALRSGIPSVRPVQASSSRCSERCVSAEWPAGWQACIGGGEATAMAVERWA